MISPGDSTSISFLPAAWRGFRLLGSLAPDLVLTCGYERPETLASVLYRLFTGSRVFLMLDNQYEDRKRHNLIERVKRLYLRLFDGFVYGGDTHRDYLRRLGVSPDREVYGYNCVDNAHISQESDRLRLSGVDPLMPGDYFLTVARLVSKKNLLSLIEAYKGYREEILSRAVPWKLVIAGEGPMRRQLESHIDALQVRDDVALLGQVGDFLSVINLHTFSKAVVLASHENEQWGLVVNEAMAASRPVIVSKQCGCASTLVREGVNGFTFDGRDVKALSSLLVHMHDNESRLDSMGAESRKIVDLVSPEVFAKNVFDLYQRVRRRS